MNFEENHYYYYYYFLPLGLNLCNTKPQVFHSETFSVWEHTGNDLHDPSLLGACLAFSFPDLP